MLKLSSFPNKQLRVLRAATALSSTTTTSRFHSTFGMPGSVETKRVFLAQPKFAVVGASKDQTKYGTKVRDHILFLDLESIR